MFHVLIKTRRHKEKGERTQYKKAKSTHALRQNKTTELWMSYL